MVFDAHQNSVPDETIHHELEPQSGQDMAANHSAQHPIAEPAHAVSELADDTTAQPLQAEAHAPFLNVQFDHETEAAADTVQRATHANGNDEITTLTAVPDIQFVQKHSKKHKLLWASLAFILIILLSMQYAVLYRDKLAVNMPRIAPIFVALCRLSGCQIKLPRETNYIQITDTSFEADPKNPNFISVHIGLENQADTAVAFPGIALSLTNDKDEIVVRKNFKPIEYLPTTSDTASGIAAHTETVAKLAIAVSDNSVSGYKILLFSDH